MVKYFEVKLNELKALKLDLHLKYLGASPAATILNCVLAEIKVNIPLSIKSSLVHLYGFDVLAQLPLLIGTTFFCFH